MILTINAVTIDPDAAEVRRNGTPLKVEPLIVDLLAHFARNPGRLITKDELFEKVWRGKIVGEAALTQAVAVVRRTLGDDGRRAEIIQTVRGRGYRLQLLQAGEGTDRGGSVAKTAAAPFVGRHALMRQLDSALESAVEGQGSLFLLHGVPGIGKSRVCDEIAGSARRRGIRVAKTAAVRGARDAWEPWGGAVEALRLAGLGGEPGTAGHLDTVRSCLQAAAAESGSGHDDVVARMIAALVAVARRAPLLLILEDLHAAAPDGLRVLVGLSRAVGGLPLLILASYRDDAADAAPKVMSKLACLATTQRERLEALSRLETARLFQLLTGRVLHDESLDAVLRDTAGNPLAVKDASKHSLECP